MNSTMNLPASVEERLSGWMQIQERRSQARVKPDPGPTLTISRAYGCEGFPLAVRLKDLMGASTGREWHIFDKALLDTVAQDRGISLRLLQDLGDSTRSLEAFGFHPKGTVTQDEAFTGIAETLIKIAQTGDAIIVGQGGAFLCRSLSNAFHFRLEASKEWRVASVIRRSGAAPAEAERLVGTQSRLRDQFIMERLGEKVSDPSHYDAVFNNETHSIECIAAAIHAYIMAAWP